MAASVPLSAQKQLAQAFSGEKEREVSGAEGRLWVSLHLSRVESLHLDRVESTAIA